MLPFPWDGSEDIIVLSYTHSFTLRAYRHYNIQLKELVQGSRHHTVRGVEYHDPRRFNQHIELHYDQSLECLKFFASAS